jgi:hypothetical protein
MSSDFLIKPHFFANQPGPFFLDPSHVFSYAFFMELEANCRSTAMGIMPHTDPERALALAMTLDVPFWPQLPFAHLSEDMWVQTAEGFPGIFIDTEEKNLDRITR